MALISPYLLGGTISLYLGFKTYKSYYSNDFEYLIDDEETISQQDLNSEIQEHQEKNENNICNETEQDINYCGESNIKEIVQKEEKIINIEPLKPKHKNKINILVCEEKKNIMEEEVLEEDKVILEISDGEKNEKPIQEEIINTILPEIIDIDNIIDKGVIKAIGNIEAIEEIKISEEKENSQKSTSVEIFDTSKIKKRRKRKKKNRNN